jgi:hypothetical protein
VIPCKDVPSHPSEPEQCSVLRVFVRDIVSQSNLVTTVGLDTYELILIWRSSCIGVWQADLCHVQDPFVMKPTVRVFGIDFVPFVQNLDANVQFLPLEFR